MRHLLFFVLLMGSLSAQAQTLIDPINKVPDGQFRLGGVLSLFKTTYERDRGEVETDLLYLGAEAATGLTPMFDLFFSVALPMSGEIETRGADYDTKSGSIFTFGSRAGFYRSGGAQATGYLAYTMNRGKFEGEAGGRNYEIEIDISELYLGGAFGFEVKNDITPYVGLELVLMSDGDFEVGSAKDDFERDERFNLKLGVSIVFNRTIVRPEVSFMGERSLQLAAEHSF